MTTLKQKTDDSMLRAVAIMHELDFEKVRLNGDIYSRGPGREKLHKKKVKVKQSDDDGDDE